MPNAPIPPTEPELPLPLPPFLGCVNIDHACSPRRQHAVLHAVQIAAVNRRHEAARHETEDDTRCQVMLAEAVAKLEVLVKHGAEREGNRLGVIF